MLRIHVPQPVYAPHPHERLITPDLCRLDDRVHLFPAVYPDFAAPRPLLSLKQDGQPLDGQDIWTGDPIAHEYTLNAPHDQLEIAIGGRELGVYRMSRRPELEPVYLTAATLFKDDLAQLASWIDFHAHHGVNRFVLYYNGTLDGILPRLSQRADLLQHDLLLIPWPYSYWVDGAPLGNEALLAQHGDGTDISTVRLNWHHAQHLMLNHALIFLRGTTEYIGFFDLDEYFSVQSGDRLCDFIRAHGQDVYIFQSRWSELSSNRVPGWADDGRFLAHEAIVAASQWEPFPHRTKYIARLDQVYSTRVHYPRLTRAAARTAVVQPELASLYHFHCFSGKAPRRGFVNPGGEWVPVHDFCMPPGLALREVSAA